MGSAFSKVGLAASPERQNQTETPHQWTPCRCQQKTSWFSNIAFSLFSDRRPRSQSSFPEGSGRPENCRETPLDRSRAAETLKSPEFWQKASQSGVLDVSVHRIMQVAKVMLVSPETSGTEPNHRSNRSAHSGAAIGNLVQCDALEQSVFLRELARYFFASFYVSIPEIRNQSLFFAMTQFSQPEAQGIHDHSQIIEDLNTVLHFVMSEYQFSRSDYVREQAESFKELVLCWSRR